MNTTQEINEYLACMNECDSIYSSTCNRIDAVNYIISNLDQVSSKLTRAKQSVINAHVLIKSSRDEANTAKTQVDAMTRAHHDILTALENSQYVMKIHFFVFLRHKLMQEYAVMSSILPKKHMVVVLSLFLTEIILHTKQRLQVLQI